MPLTGHEISTLAQLIEDQYDWTRLSVLAGDMGVNLANWAPDGSLKERAYKFISRLNSESPPRDRVFLEKLRASGNAIVRDMVTKLLTPAYLLPEDGELEAIVLGREAFIGRNELRNAIGPFTTPSPYTTRVLIVTGEEPGGKSYSWGYLRHLAFSTAGAVPYYLRLKDTGYTPWELVEAALTLLGLDAQGLPKMTDNPQPARIDRLINWVKREIPKLERRFWLVIDDLNDASVALETREAAYALACCAEEVRMDLWVVLLGYNQPITANSLGYIAQEEARFPDVELVAHHLERLARSSPSPLQPSQAREYATLLFSKYPLLDKENMPKLKWDVEEMGRKLRGGARP